MDEKFAHKRGVLKKRKPCKHKHATLFLANENTFKSTTTANNNKPN